MEGQNNPWARNEVWIILVGCSGVLTLVIGGLAALFLVAFNRPASAPGPAPINPPVADSPAPSKGSETPKAEVKRPQIRLSKGHTLSDLQFTGLNGEEVDIMKLRGRVVLIDFWATWCEPCRKEIPNVRSAYSRYHAMGFEVIGISLDSKREELEKYLSENRMVWPQYFDGKGWDNELAVRYGIRAIPATFLLDRGGVIQYTNLHGAQLEPSVAALLGAEADESTTQAEPVTPGRPDDGGRKPVPDADDITQSLYFPERQDGTEGQQGKQKQNVAIRTFFVGEGFPLRMGASWNKTFGFQEESETKVKNPPPALGKRRFKGEIVLGAAGHPNHFLFLIDDQRPDGFAMYLDADKDGDFANSAEVLQPKSPSRLGYDLDLVLHYPTREGEPHVPEPYKLYFFLNDNLWSLHGAGGYAQCHWEARLSVDGELYHLVLFDNPVDGDYSNDPVVIDLNGDGKKGGGEEFRVGDPVRFIKSTFRIESISPSGSPVVFSPGN